MCLYVDKEHSNMQTATKAIKVFKLLYSFGGEYISPYMHARYAVGSAFHNDMVMECGIVKVGLHAYQTEVAIDELLNTRRAKLVVVPMTIPKGAHYYLGDNNDIVSDTLVWSTPNTFR